MRSTASPGRALPEPDPVPGFELRGESTPLRQQAADIWRSRSLIAVLARKDFFVRYRRASFGVLWAVGLPLFQAVVLALVFSRVAPPLARGHHGNYTVFVFAGTLAWTFFSATLTIASTAVVDGSGLSTKIYFPRAVFPIVSVAANLYGFVISLVILVGLCAITGVQPGLNMLLLLPAILLMVGLTTAFSLVLAALHVYFRDVRYITQASLIAWFYVTPVIYRLDRAPGLRRALVFNPTTGLVELFRAATVGGDPGWTGTLVWSVAWMVALMVAASLLYRRYDRVFVDLM
jgi:ABC-type polysaccharide/polyol phosphate export permease